MTDFGSSQKQRVHLPESPSSDDRNNASSSANSSLSTVGQLMRSTAQAIQHLYRDRLGHTPSRVTCNLINDKLIVWAEDSITRPEQILHASDSDQLLAVSSAVKQGLRDALVQVIEKHLSVKVVTLLSDICYERKCTAMVVHLASTPRTRSSRKQY